MNNGTEKYVSAQLFRLLLIYAESGRYDADAIISASGISKDLLQNKNARIEIDRFLSAVSLLADLSGHELTGLHLVDKIGNLYSKNHILLTIMSNCSSLEEAIGKLIQYHDISSNYIKLYLKKQDRFAELIFETQIREQTGLDKILSEAAMAGCAGMFRDLTMGKARFAGIHFIYAEPGDVSGYREYFRCPPVFQSNENKIIFLNKDLDLPISLSDPELLAVLEIYARRILAKADAGQCVSESVSEMISEMILQGKGCSVDDIAKKMATSVRSLQKQLKKENLSYRILLKQVRESIAIRNLENQDVPLADIAFLLGFSEQSAFNHSFKTWTGLSPGKYRESCLLPVPSPHT